MTETLAQYLRTIQNGTQRCRAIARELGVAPATVTVTLRRLMRYGWVDYATGVASITPEGARQLEYIRRTAASITRLLAARGMTQHDAEVQSWAWAVSITPETQSALV